MKLIIVLTVLLSTLVAQASNFNDCATTDDCMLTKDGYCSRVVAVNKNDLKKWKEKDQEQSHYASAEQRTCTPLVREEQIKDFKVICIEKKCITEKIKS
jgi:hypothetical protein